MKKVFLLIILTILFARTSLVAEGKNIDKENQIILGADKIKDSQARRQIISYLSCDSKFDFKNKYKYLSSRLLEKNCYNIKNAEEYEKLMKETIEEYIKIVYVRILSARKVSKNNYQVSIISRSQESGENQNISNKEILREYSFVKEGEIWKFNGRVFGTFKVIKEK